MYPPTCATLRDEPSCNTRRIRVIKSRLEFALLPASIVPRVVNTASACNVADAKQCSNSLVLIGGLVIMYDRRCRVGFEKPMRVNSFVWCWCLVSFLCFSVFFFFFLFLLFVSQPF